MQIKLDLKTKISLFFLIFMAILIYLAFYIHKINNEIVIDNCQITGDSTLIRSSVHGIVDKILIEDNSDVVDAAPIFVIKTIVTDEEKDIITAEYNKAKSRYDALISENQRSLISSSSLPNSNQVQIDSAKAEVLKYEKLYAIGAVSQRELDNVRKKLTVIENVNTPKSKIIEKPANPEALKYATIQLAKSKELYEKIMQDRNFITMNAPISGKISIDDLKIGDEINLGQELAQIATENNLYLKMPLTTSQYEKIHLGQFVNFEINGQICSGVIFEFVQSKNGYIAKVTIGNEYLPKIKLNDVAKATILI